MVVPLVAAGRSPHIRYRPEEIDVSLDDVKGIPVVVEEAVRTLNLFLAHATFRSQMGGTPRKAILFEGPPGTGKTHLAKALAREAGVPFFFVSSSAFQSMFYGQTNRKIRSYFASCARPPAGREGRSASSRRSTPSAATRMGMGQGGGREGIAGVVNELLIQLQSFDQPSWGVRWRGGVIEMVNRLLPADRPLRKPHVPAANVLVIGATNRAADLDPALLRPGRFDRTHHLRSAEPGRAEGDPGPSWPVVRTSRGRGRTDQLAAQTFGYSPAMLVHLLDEALVWALRRGATEMSWEDVQQAKLTEEIGLAQPVEYTEAERRTIATHESGHATVAWLVGGPGSWRCCRSSSATPPWGCWRTPRIEERYTQTESELQALIQISLGGMVTEELFFGERSSGVASDLKSATDPGAPRWWAPSAWATP